MAEPRDRSRSGYGSTPNKSDLNEDSLPEVQPDDSASQIPVPGGSALSSVSKRVWLQRQLAELDRQDSLELERLARVEGDGGVEVLGTNGWAPAGSGQVLQSPRTPTNPQPQPN